MSTTIIPFYHTWDGDDSFPINVDEGSADDPHDFDFWQYCKDHGTVPAKPKQQATESEDVSLRFECSICLDTLYMPVMPLCMHIFCYTCLVHWLRKGLARCPLCSAVLIELPIRDNAFEMELADAIEDGAIVKATGQVGKKVIGKDEDYVWDGVALGDA